jgi:hypothetical protein
MKILAKSIFATLLYGALGFQASGQDYVPCHADSAVSGEYTGTEGTRGTWAWSYIWSNGTKYGGGYINICGYGAEVSDHTGTSYFGRWDGDGFTGWWYKLGTSCRSDNASFICENTITVPTTESGMPTAQTDCWGNFSFEIPSGLAGGQEAQGSWDYCGGATAREDLDAGPWEVRAVHYERW